MQVKINTHRKLGKAPTLCDGDFYFDGLYMVFTSKFHIKRGYCCNSGCRHCPFKVEKKQA